MYVCVCVRVRQFALRMLFAVTVQTGIYEMLRDAIMVAGIIRSFDPCKVFVRPESHAPIPMLQRKEIWGCIYKCVTSGSRAGLLLGFGVLRDKGGYLRPGNAGLVPLRFAVDLRFCGYVGVGDKLRKGYLSGWVG